MKENYKSYTGIRWLHNITMSITLQVICSKCKKPMMVTGNHMGKVCTCEKCGKRESLDNRTVEIINWYMYI